jgi:hypothetical protein
MSFGEQWRLLSLINLSWIETSLGSFSQGLAPLLIDRPVLHFAVDITETLYTLRLREQRLRQNDRFQTGMKAKLSLVISLD